MKSFLMSFLVLSLGLTLPNIFSTQAQASKTKIKPAITGQGTITFMPETSGGWIEIDLRQDASGKILGNSSLGGMVNFDYVKANSGVSSFNNGIYQGMSGFNTLTNLRCTSSGPDQSSCDGFINGMAADLNTALKTKKTKTYLETRGTVNNGSLYQAKKTADSLEIFAWNSLDVKKIKDGVYKGEATLGATGIYDVTIKMSGTLQGLLDDPAMVAIFLGELIAR